MRSLHYKPRNDDKVLTNRGTNCLHASCWMFLWTSWCTRESMENEPLHLTISFHYLWELSIAHTPASVHFVYCSGMYQLSISAKCTIKYSCKCCAEMPDTHFTKDYLLCFLRNALQAFDHWTTGEKAAFRKWLSNMSTTSAKAPYDITPAGYN